MIGALAAIYGEAGHEERVAAAAKVDEIFIAAAARLRELSADLRAYARPKIGATPALAGAADALVAVSFLESLAGQADQLRERLRASAAPWGET